MRVRTLDRSESSLARSERHGFGVRQPKPRSVPRPRPLPKPGTRR